MFGSDPVSPAVLSRWRSLLERRMALFELMPGALQDDVLRFIPGFLKHKTFYGQYGLEVDEPMQVLIAAHAALVGRAQPVSFFRSVRWVLVYPDLVDLDGEAFGVSKVVLSWQRLQEESEAIYYGANLGVHEFAHVMDQLLGLSGGTEALRAGFDAFRARLLADQPSVFSEVGLEGPEEFFSVAAEAFFSVPHDLAREDAALHDDLCRLYGTDTRQWIPPFESLEPLD
ncbi:zinc-dependent peptidase [Motiliproteus sp. SC1-56]|uniref:zinc-dependent peptidase n=1 Tax=Motiliproteus sp. SC1-56 TaxID=2799565 RepID=UPI001A8F318E|nr:zinc-dependent peptidase [Motiliproteus sp. SC1-56]